MQFLKGVQDEDMASVLCGADFVLIIEEGVPKRLDLSLLSRFSLSSDQWVVFIEGGIALVE